MSNVSKNFQYDVKPIQGKPKIEFFEAEVILFFLELHQVLVAETPAMKSLPASAAQVSECIKASGKKGLDVHRKN
jgi:hypothetical protein